MLGNKQAKCRPLLFPNDFLCLKSLANLLELSDRALQTLPLYQRLTVLISG